MLPKFNDYLIFADEAGDHLLRPNDKEFPIFVLAFCIVKRDHYANFIAPKLLDLKLKYFQDPHVILHERDIRKADKEFSFLTNAEIRNEFMNDLNTFMSDAEFHIIASAIRKDKLQQRYTTPDNPYDIATGFCMERALYFLNRREQITETTVAFEARGKKEDADLELSFLRITNKKDYNGRFGIKILPKISNCCGLQLADLVARPIGRHVLNPDQENRAYEIIKNKMDNYNGMIRGYGLKTFP